MQNVVITGGSSGLGKAIINELLREDANILNIDLCEPKKYVYGVSDYVCTKGDVSDLARMDEISKDVVGNAPIGGIDILINCAGINYINWIEDTTEGAWDLLIGVNAKGIFNTCKAFMPQLLTAKGTILNIVSNASHMPMTNSIAYNASKGAAHIMTLQMARELGPKGITVFGISPNKLSGTGMSKYIDETVPGLRGWTPEQAAKYQLNSLPAGEETDTDTLAEFIQFILSSKQRHKYMAGTIIPYGK